jgi:hypothetical protein
MAIATATAAIIGASVAIASAVASGAQAGAAASKSKGAQRAAEAQAKRKLKEAKREIQIMPMQELALDLEGYRQEQEASQVAAAQSIQAAQQAEGRGLAAAVGRTQMADVAQQRAARLDKATEMQKLEMLKAKERQEASDKLANLSLSEAQGAQEAAAQEEMMAQQYTQQAVGAAAEAAKGAANLYSAVQGPYDPTGVKGASQSGLKSLTDRGDFVDFQDYLKSDPSVLPSGVVLPKNIGSLSEDEMSTFFGTFESGRDVRNLLSGYDRIYR